MTIFSHVQTTSGAERTPTETQQYFGYYPFESNTFLLFCQGKTGAAPAFFTFFVILIISIGKFLPSFTLHPHLFGAIIGIDPLSLRDKNAGIVPYKHVGHYLFWEIHKYRTTDLAPQERSVKNREPPLWCYPCGGTPHLHDLLNSSKRFIADASVFSIVFVNFTFDSYYFVCFVYHS